VHRHPIFIDNYIISSSVVVHPVSDEIENAPAVDEEATPLRARIAALENHYYPGWCDPPEGVEDVLGFLHHRNISHIRAKLLKEYSFSIGDTAIYIDGIKIYHFLNRSVTLMLLG
jgi:hypothetical protein